MKSESPCLPYLLSPYLPEHCACEFEAAGYEAALGPKNVWYGAFSASRCT
jgi:hypothetical protein